MGNPILPHMTPLETGQLWKMNDSRVEITMVGKLLVHFRHFRGDAKRTSHTSLQSKADLEKYLKKHKAVVVSA